MALTLFFHIPGDYNDVSAVLGNCADYTAEQAERWLERYDELIAERLPSGLSWYGDEIWADEDCTLNPLDWDDIWDDICDSAWEQLCKETGDDEDDEDLDNDFWRALRGEI